MSDYSTLLRRVYGDIVNPVAPENSISEAMPFRKSDKLGERYEEPVRMSTEQGATYNNDHTGFAVSAAVPAEYKTAFLSGSEILFQGAVSYGDLSRLSEAKGSSKAAADSAISRLILDLTEGAENHREINCLYGASTAGLANLGVASAVAVAASGGVITVNISRATFAPGMWQVLKGVKLTAFNATASLDSIVKVTGMDVSKCRIQLTEVTSGAAAAIGVAIGAGNMPAFFFAGARTKSMAGLQVYGENTGTLNGIDASLYPLWKAQTFSAGTAALTFDKIQEGCTGVADVGLKTGLDLWIGNKAWADLANDEAAFRQYVENTGGKDANVGFAKLSFVMSCGKVTIRPHLFMKQGIAIGTPTKECVRRGSRDISFELPGNPNKFFWSEDPNNAQSSIRNYSDQCVHVQVPSHLLLFTAVQSSADCVPS